MADPSYAMRIFESHMAHADRLGINNNGTFLELGPGDSAASALLASIRGASTVYLVDVGDFITRDMDFYAKLIHSPEPNEASSRFPDTWTDFNSMLEACNARYFVEGLDSLAAIPNDSVHFIWSQAVLEHVRVHDFSGIVSRMYRVLSPGGGCSHLIDLKDHLGGALNNLRFSHSFWEQEWVASSGFYTNRLRPLDILDVFEKAGFQIIRAEIDRWDKLPTPRKRMAQPFRDMKEEELLAKRMRLVIQKP